MGGAVFPPCCLTWGQTVLEIMKIIATSFNKSLAHCLTQCPGPCSRPSPIDSSARDSWTLTGKSGSVSWGDTVPFSCVLVCTRFCLGQEPVSPVLCKFWWLSGGVNGDLLQEGLCHMQVGCTQSPCPCGMPLLIHSSTGDTQTIKSRSGLVFLEKEMATHSSTLAWKIPWTERLLRAWWATVHGVAKSWTWLSDMASPCVHNVLFEPSEHLWWHGVWF